LQYIDPSIYASRRSSVELELMSAAGIASVIEPTTIYGAPRNYAETFMDDYDRLIGPERQRARRYGLGYAVCLGVPPQEAANAQMANRVLDALPAQLANECVVALGEIGLEHGTPDEERAFVRQIRIARQAGLPIVVGTPGTHRREGLVRTLALLIEEGMPANYVVINGVTEDTLPLVRGYGCWFGLTIDPETHLSPTRTAQLLRHTGVEGAMIHSAAGRIHGDPLAVPRTARALLQAGFALEEVERLTFHNPKWFFSQGRPLPLPAAQPVMGRERATSQYNPMGLQTPVAVTIR
jgi:predicted metal-dependent TIM-barrel fold hydrolase